MTTLLDRYDLLLADLDGTLYRGREVVPRAVEAVRRAGERGVRTVYVTNNASRSPATVAAHLAELGYPAAADDVATSPQAAAALLAEQLPAGAKVLVVGTDALVEQVEAAGLVAVRTAEGAAAVVQGLDPELRYAALAEACIALRAGALWVACNMDRTLPTERGPLPGNGSLVAVLETATDRTPQVAGKPSPTLMRTAAERAGGTAPLVVGDVLYTDIQGGRSAGMATMVVLTGAARPVDILTAAPDLRPDYIGADLDALDLDADGLAPGPRPGWTVHGNTGALTLAGSGSGPDAALDALRALCAHHWAEGGGPAEVTTDGDDAAAVVRTLGLAHA